MAQIINPLIMEELRMLAIPLTDAAKAHAPEITHNDPSVPANGTAVAEAEAITAVTATVSAVLQCFPITQGGVIVAMGAVCGTVLGQCDGDRAELYAMFKHQMARTLAEIVAARMPAEGHA